MEENDRKQGIQRAFANVEFHLAPLTKDEVSIKRYTQLPLDELAARGTAFEPLVTALQKAFSGKDGTSGLYRVNTKGGQLFEFKNGSGFTGGIKTAEGAVGGGQAILNPVAFNPTMMFMAIALYSVDCKLDSIHEAQQEMIEFLELKERSELKGNLNYLTDVLNNYKYNWTNEQYKKANHLKVLDIKQDSEQKILFYREQIEKTSKKQLLLHGDKDVKTKLGKIQSDFEGYQLALYLFSFSSFLEVMLLENYESAYLDATARKIEDYALRYRELYTGCYNLIEGDLQSSLQSHLLKGLASASKAVGGATSNIPGVGKTQIDETLIKTGGRLEAFRSKRTDRTMEQFINHQSSAIRPFVDNIDNINALYNQPIELLFDEDNCYFGQPE
jgi:hypothetical protein